MTTPDLEANINNNDSNAAACEVRVQNDASSPTMIPGGVITAVEQPAHDESATPSPTNSPRTNNSEEQQVESDEQTAEALARRDWQAKQQQQTGTHSSRPVVVCTPMQQSKPDEPQLVTTTTLVPGESTSETFNKNLAAEAWNRQVNPEKPSATHTRSNKDDTRHSGHSLLGAVSVTGDLNEPSQHSTTAASIQHLRPVHRDSYTDYRSRTTSGGGTTNPTTDEHNHDRDNVNEVVDLEQQQQQQEEVHGNTATPTENDNDNNSNANGSGEMLLEATLVEDHHHHDDRHGDNNHHHNNAEVMTAAKVVEAEELYCGFSRRQWLSLGGCLVCLVAVVAVVISLAVVNNDSNSLQDTPPSASMAPTPTPRPPFEMLRDRGFFLFGI